MKKLLSGIVAVVIALSLTGIARAVPATDDMNKSISTLENEDQGKPVKKPVKKPKKGVKGKKGQKAVKKQAAPASNQAPATSESSGAPAASSSPASK